MDQDGHPQRAVQAFVAEGDRVAQERSRVVARQRGLPEHRPECFAGKQRFARVAGVQAADEGAMDAVHRDADRLGGGMVARHGAHPARRARIVRRPRRRVGHRRANLFEEPRRQLPRARGHEDLRRDAVRTGVVELLGRDVRRLKYQVGLRPRAGDHDHRGDVAQLARHRFGDDGLPGVLARRGVGSAAENDRVVGLLAAGKVDRVDPGMRSQIRPGVGAPACQTHEPLVDEGCEDARKDRQQVCVDRVELEQCDAAVRVEYREDVERWNARDVTGSEHQRDASRGLGAFVEARDVVAQRGARHLGLHPNLGAQTVEQDAVRSVDGEHLDDDLASLS